MDHKVGAFCELLWFLHNRHDSWARDPATNVRRRKLHDEVSRSLRLIDERKLEAFIRELKRGSSIDFILDGVFLFLKPPEHETAVLPVLSLMGNFSKSELRIRMALFTFDESEAPAAIGFRFETPEGEGLHNYYHAQLIRGFGKNTEDFPPKLSWLPVSQPALMLSAKSPYSLFLGVLIGLYGLGNLEREWQGQKFPLHLKQDLEDLKSGCGVR